MDFNTGYNFVNDDESLLHSLKCDPTENRTQQQFKDETDINVIVERFGLTGQLPPDFRMPLPNNSDLTNAPADFQTAMNYVIEAQHAFMQLPGTMRERFAHDPQKLLDFLENDKNREEAEKLGLIPLPPEKTRETITPSPDATNNATKETKQ